MKTPTYSSSTKSLIRRFPKSKIKLEEIVASFVEKTNAHENIEVILWMDTYLYIQVTDSRWAYPHNMRALCTFCMKLGRVMTSNDCVENFFARTGWYQFLSDLLGEPSRLYSDSGKKPAQTLAIQARQQTSAVIA